MGWEGGHLHLFLVDDEEFSEPYEDGYNDGHDERLATLKSVLGHYRRKITYVYDFGDNWRHSVELEKTLPEYPGMKYPMLVDGRRRCPPEDCGGIWGYQRALAARTSQESDEEDFSVNCLGNDWDPNDFNVVEAEINLRGLCE